MSEYEKVKQATDDWFKVIEDASRKIMMAMDWLKKHEAANIDAATFAIKTKTQENK